MTLDQIIKELSLQVLTEKKDFSTITPTHGYVSDMLSCVMAGAKNKSIWVTLQAHNNIVAVGLLVDAAAVIITEGLCTLNLRYNGVHQIRRQPDFAQIVCRKDAGRDSLDPATAITRRH